jgi:CubicO group peptidase (beta-lactamase class C family)
MRALAKHFRLAAVLVLTACTGLAQTAPIIAPDVREKVDNIARQVLTESKVPSISLAVVKDGHVEYTQAYGDAKLDPATPARPDMRYSIGSVSKQFTATAILMLADEGKLSLDDPVSRFIPTLTSAKEITIRQLLSHTSGYQDYWPQDYVPPFMLQPITAEQIMDRWARRPLDFDPGTQWQYSNTNFVIAGVVVEKASGMPFMQFLKTRIFEPLGMKSVMDIDQNRLTESDATGYMRNAFGPLRPSPKEGKGWLFAAGELAMTAQDLAKWDIGIIDRRLLKPASYKEFETNVRLNNGLDSGYALGVGVHQMMGHRTLSHGGEVSGFCSQNLVFPDDRIAVVAFANQISTEAAGDVARKVAQLLLTSGQSTGKIRVEEARAIFTGLQQGKIDRSLFTDNANFYFNEQALKDFATSLGPLGTPQDFTELEHDSRGGMIGRTYRIKFPDKVLIIRTYELPDGKWEQYELAN